MAARAHVCFQRQTRAAPGARCARNARAARACAMRRREARAYLLYKECTDYQRQVGGSERAQDAFSLFLSSFSGVGIKRNGAIILLLSCVMAMREKMGARPPAQKRRNARYSQRRVLATITQQVPPDSRPTPTTAHPEYIVEERAYGMRWRRAGGWQRLKHDAAEKIERPLRRTRRGEAFGMSAAIFKEKESLGG